MSSDQLIILVLCIIISFLCGLLIHRLFGYRLIKISKNVLEPVENYDYLKGKEQGEKQHLERFNITYTPYIERHDSFFTNKAEIGHQMQLFYDGFPIIPPIKTILESNIKFKEENILMLHEMIDTSIKEAAAAYATRGLSYTINDGEKAVKKRNKK